MFYEVFIFEHNLSNLRLYCTSANTHCSHCYSTKYATYLILMFLSVPASSAGAYWWCVYLPLEHFALWVKPTFHIFTENFRLVGSPYFCFWSQKKIFTKILGCHLSMYLNMYPMYFLTLKWKLDSVKDQVFIEVEKNPVLYHNLLTLNFNTDLGSKWALR